MKNKQKITIGIWSAVCLIVVALMIGLTIFATYWDMALRNYFGVIGEGVQNPAGVTEEETIYYPTSLTDAELSVKQKQLADQIVAEGTVLLKNEKNALPLKKKANISVFGVTAYQWFTKDRVDQGLDLSTAFTNVLESAEFNVNTSLNRTMKSIASSHQAWGTGDLYGDGSTPGSWGIDEATWSEYASAEYTGYQDAAIIILSRGGTEGADLPRWMGNQGGLDDSHYLQLTAEEKSLLSGVAKAGFEKTILILHTTNAMQMDFINTASYGIDACLWVSGTGADSASVLGKILNGDISPSGHLTDTFVTDNFSAPAMQNFGDFRFTRNGELSGYSYVNYAEGIYVGYKYYETRYEDVMLGKQNVGNYDYSSTVAYPFGHGLSYAKFDWSNYSVDINNVTEEITVSLTVTNNGSYDGKEVIGIYYQAPYIVGGVEKAAVNLVEFAKTGLLKKNGGSEKVEVTFDASDMKSYDANAQKTYIMDIGKYYITAAPDAHAAVNNILAKKSNLTSGNKDFVDDNYELASSRRLATSETGATITNLFDEAKLSDATYLSRSNWAVMDSWSKASYVGGIAYATGTKTKVSASTNIAGTVSVHEASDDVHKGLTAVGWEASGNPYQMDGSDGHYQPIITGEKNGIELVDMREKDASGEFVYERNNDKWQLLLNQMSLTEMHELYAKAGWGTVEVKSINKPKTISFDGPQGLVDFFAGNNGYQYTAQNVLGATWSKKLASEMGDLIGEESLRRGLSGWWAPGVNIHRSPFSGRNFEYYSEDGVLSGKLAAEQVINVQKYGVTCFPKHMFMNDQETNRQSNGSAAAFAEEQAIRELYAVPFEICVKDAQLKGIMSAMNRVGYHFARGYYALNNLLVRDEWGFDGAILTDYNILNANEALECIAGGCDMQLTTSGNFLTRDALQSVGVQNELRRAAHNVCFIQSQSSAMNGFVHGSKYYSGFAVYIFILIAAGVFFLIMLAYGTFEVIFLYSFKDKFVIKPKLKWGVRIAAWTVAAAVIITLIVMFFTTWLPALQLGFSIS